MSSNRKTSTARTNLAANLARLGKLDLAAVEFTKAIKLEPRNFDANHNLGELYARSGKAAEAAPFLEQAQRSILRRMKTVTIWP